MEKISTLWLGYIRKIFFIVFCSTMVFLFVLIVFAGKWLAPKSDHVRSTDAILILAGSYDRTLYAADLYNQGISHKILISRPVPEQVNLRLNKLGIPVLAEEDFQKKILLHLGVPEQNIEFLPGYAKNTKDEILALNLYLNNSDKKITIVTSAYHVRRVQLILNRYEKDINNFQILPTPYEEFDWQWWHSPASARAVVLELTKVLYFSFNEIFRR